MSKHFCVLLFFDQTDATIPYFINVKTFPSYEKVEESIINNLYNKETIDFESKYLRIQAWYYSESNNDSELICEKEFYEGKEYNSYNNENHKPSVILSFAEYKRMFEENNINKEKKN